MGPKEPNEIDRLVGSRVRQRRMQLGMSQEQLAEQLGLTVPQVQKYEKGVNRIGASRLHKIAGLLGVPIGAFFEAHAGAQASAPEAGGAEAGGAEAGAAEAGQPDPSVFADRETIALALAFSRITRPQLRRALIELTRAVAHLDEPASDKPVSGA
jgi:transcriptional regulator with XRE-family HTH domain